MQDRTPTTPIVPDFAPVPRKYRHDGWTEARQRAFIDALASSGSFKHAAKAVNMSTEGAYQLRRQPGAEAFAAAWAAALDHGIQRLEDIALERAIHGVEVPVYSFGKLIGTRIVYNDKLLMFLLRNRSPDRFAASAAAQRISQSERAKIEQQLRAEFAAQQAEDDEAVGAFVRAEMDKVRARLLDGLPPIERGFEDEGDAGDGG